MTRFDAGHDTIPCPPPWPESGEHAAVHIHVLKSEQDLAPQLIESVVLELRALLAGLKCLHHGKAPVVHVEVGFENDATTRVIPLNCCAVLDGFLAQALEGSHTFRLINPT
jgi:hypothetical protein